jgi:hypothetical protein
MDAPPRGAPGAAAAGTLRHFYCRVVTAEAKLVRSDTASEPEIARPRSPARSPAAAPRRTRSWR